MLSPANFQLNSLKSLIPLPPDYRGLIHGRDIIQFSIPSQDMVLPDTSIGQHQPSRLSPCSQVEVCKFDLTHGGGDGGD